MDRLPTEILDVVFQHLDGLSDIQSIRLCCRNMATIGLRYLVPTVNVTITKSSLERLQYLAQHPVHNKYVRKLIIYRNICKDYETMEPSGDGDDEGPQCRWAKDVTPYTISESYTIGYGYYVESYWLGRVALNPTKMSNVPQHVQDALWSQHQRILADQTDLIRSGELFRIVEESIAMFPSLQSFHTRFWSSVIFPGTPFIRFNPIRPVENIYLSPGKPPPRWMRRFSFTDELIGAVFQGLGMSQSNIKCLNLDSVDLDFLGMKCIQSAISSCNLKTLEEIQIFIEADHSYFPSEEEQDRYIANFTGGQFRGFLAAAAALRVLKFQNTTRIGILLNWKFLFGSNHWRNLSHLELSKTGASKDEILSFFKRHADTLRILLLEDVWIPGGELGWIQILKHMHACLKLEDATFKGWFTARDSNDYIDTYSKMPGYPPDLRVGTALRYLFCEKAEHLSYSYHDYTLDDLKRFTLDDDVSQKYNEDTDSDNSS